MHKRILIAFLPLVHSCGSLAVTRQRTNEVYNALKRLEKKNLRVVIALYQAAHSPKQTLTRNHKYGPSQEEFTGIADIAKYLGLCNDTYFIDYETANIIRSCIHTIHKAPDYPLVVEVCHPKSLFTWTELIKKCEWLIALLHR